MTPPLLSIDSLTKAYPGVVANDAVSMDIRDGEVHAVLGENGAGKSTLVKMIYGLVKPDSGTMRLRGAPYAPADPNAARKAGVAMVFQHFSLFDAMPVAENVALGMAAPPRLRELSARIREVSQAYGLPLDPDRIGEGGRRFLLRETGHEDTGALLADLGSVTARAAECIDAALNRVPKEAGSET